MIFLSWLFGSKNRFALPDLAGDTDILHHTITWLITQRRKSQLAIKARNAGSVGDLISRNAIEDFWRDVYILLHDFEVSDQDKDTLRLILLRRQEIDRRSKLDVHEGLWRTGGDLSPFLHGIRDDARRTAVADCIGDDLVGLPFGHLPKKVKDALWRFAGPSGLLNGLFTDADLTEPLPGDRELACVLVSALRERRTEFEIVVWHGFGWAAHSFRDTPVDNMFPSHLCPLHCSLWSYEAIRHAAAAEPTRGKHQLLGRILLPKGSPALYRPNHPVEYEVILPPNTQMRVTAREIVPFQAAATGLVEVVHLEPIFHDL